MTYLYLIQFLFPTQYITIKINIQALFSLVVADRDNVPGIDIFALIVKCLDIKDL
jgi:hypothetical protein